MGHGACACVGTGGGEGGGGGSAHEILDGLHVCEVHKCTALTDTHWAQNTTTNHDNNNATNSSG